MSAAQERQGRVQHVDEIMTAVIRADRWCDRDVAQASIDQDVNTAMVKYVVAGVDLAPKEAETKLRDEFRRRYDETVRFDLIQLNKDIAATTQDLDARIERSRHAPEPKADVADTLREMLWRDRLRGRTLAEVVAAYKHRTDHVLTWMVEQDEPETMFQLQPHDNSVETAATMFRLNALRRQRQEARQDAKLVELRQRLRDMLARNLRLQRYLADATDPSKRFQIATVDTDRRAPARASVL